ncbi:aldehyde dehydrogenase [Meredithblackwellia eburnea MCA 4105]
MSFLNNTPVPSYVDGAPFTGSATFNVLDPHDNSKVLHQVSSITEADVPKVVGAAAKAFKTWRNTSVSERRRIVLKAAALLQERLPEYAGVEYGETTSSQGWSGFDITLAIGALEEAGSVATTALRGEVATTDAGQKAYITRVPYGVVFGISPWNAPVVLSQRAVIQPIIAGNTAILKTSELSPKTQLTLAQVFHDAGLPAGVLNIIHVSTADSPAVTKAIIASDEVRKINFTGSTRVGSIVAKLAGEYLKPTVMELGGKAPAIVLADADLQNAATAIMFGGFFHSGQICMATQTALVHESIKDEFLKLINAHVPTLSASGDNSANAPLRGLFTNASASRVEAIVKDATSKGATVAAGKIGFKDNVVQPVLLENVNKDMRIYGEECFAPVFSLIPFKTEEEAIQIANDHEYGLAAAVFSRDIPTAIRVAEQIDSGAVHINGATVHDSANMPHGGMKKSGWGRFNGKEGIQEFTQLKVITVNDPHPYPI